MPKLRGADILARALASAGAREIFSLSGNQIMPLYDAAIDARLYQVIPVAAPTEV